MMREPQPQFVSVKFDAVGRPHRFLLPEIDFEPPLQAGEQVVVTRGERLAYGTVARSVPQLAARRAPAVTSTSRVLRRVSTLDVTARLTQQHREREADRVCGMKIKERGLAMKLVKVEHELDGPRLVFYFTAEAHVDFRELVRELRVAAPLPDQHASDRSARRGQAIGRIWHLRTPPLLHDVAAAVRAHLDQDGQAATPEPEPLPAVGLMRPIEVLFAVRTAEREG